MPADPTSPNDRREHLERRNGTNGHEPRSPLGYPRRTLAPGETLGTVSTKIGDIVLQGQHPRGWWVGFGVAFLLLMVFLFSIFYLFYKGVGIWGVNVPVAWGFAIINFVWWTGIGHAGTFISASLLLVFRRWRDSINRFTEAMTLFHPVSEHDGSVAAVPLPAGVGRVRHVHLLPRVAAVLVSG